MIRIFPHLKQTHLQQMFFSSKAELQNILQIADKLFIEKKYAETTAFLDRHLRFEKDDEFQYHYVRSVIEKDIFARGDFTTRNIFFGRLVHPVKVSSPASTEREAFDPINPFDGLSVDIRHHNTSRVKIDPEKIKMIFYKGIHHYVIGEWLEAEATLKEIEKVIPEAALKLGHIKLLQGNPIASEKYYDLALRTAEETPLKKGIELEGLIGRAFINIEKNNWTAASRLLNQAYEINRETTANNLMGWVSYRIPQVYFSAVTLGVRNQQPITFDGHKEVRQLLAHLGREDNVVDRQTNDKDLDLAQKLLYHFHESKNLSQRVRRIFVGEVLSKILAFLSFPNKTVIEVPTADGKLCKYTIHEKKIAKNIPILFLTPEIPNSPYPPILIFRGTNLDFFKPKSWESILHNFDPRGITVTLFDESKSEIEEFLQTIGKSYTQVMGYSQGGALAAMTVNAFPKLICTNPDYPSMTFHPPGIRKDDMALQTEKLNLEQYPVRTDIISRLGQRWIGNVYQIEFNKIHTFFNPHFIYTFAQPEWKCVAVDSAKDNDAPLRNLLTPLVSSSPLKAVFRELDKGTFGVVVSTINSLLSKSGIEPNFAWKLASGFWPIAQKQALGLPKALFSYAIKKLS